MWYVAFAIACFTNLSPTFAGVPDKPYAEVLAGKKFCLACHNVNVKMVGPAYKDVAAKGESVDVLVNSILNGSGGKWGQIPMPAQAVTEEEAKMLAEWILGLE
jgi:cytochrome c